MGLYETIMSTSILVYKNISKFLIVCTVKDLQWKFTRWSLHINLYDKYRTIFFDYYKTPRSRLYKLDTS